MGLERDEAQLQRLDCQDRRLGFGLWAKESQWLQIRGWAAVPTPQELARPWHPELCAPRGPSEHGKWTSEVQDMLLGGTWVKF